MTASAPVTCQDVRDLAAGYVLGALERDEAAAIEAHLGSCSEPHPELAELGGVVPYLALSTEPVEPSSALRARVLAAVAADRKSIPGRHERAVSLLDTWLGLRGGKRLRLGIAAVAIVIVALIGSTGYLAVRLSQTQDYATALARAATLAAVPGSRIINLAPAPDSGVGSISGIAVVSSGSPGIVVVEGLEPTAGSQVYEAWIIVGSSAPEPAGSFGVGSDHRGWLQSLPTAPTGPLTIALTREPGPGATRPTPPILVSGTAGA